MAISQSPQRPVLGFLTVLSDPQAGLFGGYLVLNWAGRPLEFHCTAPIKPNRAQQILYGPTLEPYLYGEQIGRALVSKTQHTPSLLCTDVLPAIALRPYVDWPMMVVLPGSSSDTQIPLQRGMSLSGIEGRDHLGASGDGPSAKEPTAGPMLWMREEPQVPSFFREETGGPHGEPPLKDDDLPPHVYCRFDPPHPGVGRLMLFRWAHQQFAVLENLPQDYQQVQETLSSLDPAFDFMEPFGRIREAIQEARRGG